MLRLVMYVTVLGDLKEHIELSFPTPPIQTLSTNSHDGIITGWLFNGLHRKGWVSAQLLMKKYTLHRSPLLNWSTKAPK